MTFLSNLSILNSCHHDNKSKFDSTEKIRVVDMSLMIRRMWIFRISSYIKTKWWYKFEWGMRQAEESVNKCLCWQFFFRFFHKACTTSRLMMSWVHDEKYKKYWVCNILCLVNKNLLSYNVAVKDCSL